jgi:hypothetical protein
MHILYMNNESTKLKALALVVAEAIRELGTVPSGHLYARLMGFFSIEQYAQLIDLLKAAGLVREQNHLLSWTGEAK